MLSESKIHSVIHKNKLFVPNAFMHISMKNATTSQIIAYEPIMSEDLQVGWAIIWRVLQFTSFLLIEKEEVIHVVGVFVLPDHRNQGLAESAVNKVLKNYKMSKYYLASMPISYCDTWNKFNNLIKKNKLKSKTIKAISTTLAEDVPDFFIY